MAIPGPATKDDSSGFVRALISSGAGVTAERGWDEGIAQVPAVPAVIALESDGRTVLLGTTADARNFIARRLGSIPPEERGTRAELGAVVSRARIVWVSSGFEADLAYLAMARERLPAQYARIMSRWGAGFVRLDPSDTAPEPQKIALSPLPEAHSERLHPGVLVGPVAEKRVQALHDAVIDAFDLCRYPAELRQAPRGTACAYKEMGRCPAPCDGTEPLGAFRARVAEAVRVLGSPAAERAAAATVRMKAAAAAGRFEEAAALKRAIERLDALDSPGLRAGVFERYRHVVIASGGAPGRARLFAWRGGLLVSVRDVASERSPEIEAFAEQAASGEVPIPLEPGQAEGVAVLSRWAAEGSQRRRVWVVRSGEGDTLALIRQALRTALRRGPAEAAEVGVEESELAGGS